MKTQYETPEMIVYHFAVDKEIMAEIPGGSSVDPGFDSIDFDSLLNEDTYFGE